MRVDPRPPAQLPDAPLLAIGCCCHGWVHTRCALQWYARQGRSCEVCKAAVSPAFWPTATTEAREGGHDREGDGPSGWPDLSESEDGDPDVRFAQLPPRVETNWRPAQPPTCTPSFRTAVPCEHTRGKMEGPRGV